MAKLFWRYSTMNAGKSFDVLKTFHNYKEQGKKALLFTSSIADRDGVGFVSSRVGLKEPAIIINSDTDIVGIALQEEPDAILVDEAQFLTEANVQQLSDLAVEHNIPVLCYGLRSDFLDNLFPGSAALFAKAETIEELVTECWFSRKKATLNLRVIDGKPVFEGEQVVIGDTADKVKDKQTVAYYPVSRKVYNECKRTGELPEFRQPK